MAETVNGLLTGKEDVDATVYGDTDSIILVHGPR